MNIDHIDIALGFSPAADSIRYPRLAAAFEFYRFLPGAGMSFEQTPTGEFILNATAAPPISGPANQVLATPNGSPGPVSLRGLVTPDLPNPIDGGTF